MNLKDIFKLGREEAPEIVAEQEEISSESEVARRLPITEKEIKEATVILNRYKAGKARLEEKLRANEEFWKMRQWDRGVGGAVVNGENPDYKISSTPWLHSCIESRHADAMDSYPTCNFLARNKDDEAEAKKLSEIMPVVLSYNDFEQTYDDVSRYTLKQGTGCYGIFWDPSKHNGLGDISITMIDLFSLFVQPGVKNIQASDNVFVTDLVDNKHLEQKYPQTKGKLGGKNITVGKYLYDENVDTSQKSVVVDWYYKKTAPSGKKVLHYCKYVNDIVLFASENEPEYQESGFYNHGLYPFEVQALYPVEGSIFGYGLTDVAKDTQIDIDRLNKAIVDNAEEGATSRYFIKNTGAINEKEFADKTKKFVHVEGSVNDDNIRPMNSTDLPGNSVAYLQAKINELKFCTANQDVNNGATPSGVTSGTAIAALQETSGKNARNSNRTFHRAYKGVINIAIELIRQFYNEPRQFRIATDLISNQYVTYSNAGIQPQPQMFGGNDMGMRVPEFDIEVTVEKANPYKKLENNELMLQFYGLGLFSPQNTDQAVMLLSNMDFDGKDDIVSQVRQQGTMYDLMLRYQQIALQLAQKVDPNLANQLAQTILSSNGASVPMVDLGGDIASAEKEHPFVEKSRAQARASTQAE